MLYNPESPSHREELAHQLLDTLSTAGFKPVTRKGTYEAMYARGVPEAPGLRVLVYTSIEPYQHRPGFAVRVKGSDAIRVLVEYASKDGKPRGVSNESRVNRTGRVEDICDRMLDRMRGAYSYARKPRRCKDCAAPTFKSKGGNDVCADICWEKPRNTAVASLSGVGFSSFSMDEEG